MHQEKIHRDPWSFLARSWFSQMYLRTWSRWLCLSQMGRSCRTRFSPIECQNQNIFIYTHKLVDLSQEVWKHWRTIEKTFWLRPSVVYTKPFTPRIWRTTTQDHAVLEVPATATVIEFFLHLVAMEWILVVFLRIQRKSIKGDCMRRFMVERGNPLSTDLWVKPQTKGFQEFILFCCR